MVVDVKSFVDAVLINRFRNGRLWFAELCGPEVFFYIFKIRSCVFSSGVIASTAMGGTHVGTYLGVVTAAPSESSTGLFEHGRRYRQ